MGGVSCADWIERSGVEVGVAAAKDQGENASYILFGLSHMGIKVDQITGRTPRGWC
jgi:hypothetical protein